MSRGSKAVPIKVCSAHQWFRGDLHELPGIQGIVLIQGAASIIGEGHVGKRITKYKL
jgi:hypothetical protein